MPNAAELAALRAWYEGLGAKQAVVRYLGHTKADGQSSRGMLGAARRLLMAYARQPCTRRGPSNRTLAEPRTTATTHWR
jgi:hypothetical protein